MQCFGDSFDLYAAVADMANGYWDTVTVGSNSLQPGRFAGGQCFNFTNNVGSMVKSSGANDSVHHFVFGFLQNVALTGTTLGMAITLADGATSQCSIVFRSDGAILLTSGGAAGTTLATYTGAVTLQNSWFAFEIEVVVHNTNGSITVRKNNNQGTPDFTLGSLNTRNSANNYASKITIQQSAAVNPQRIDDFLWRSDPSAVSWVGDIRCYTRMPASDVQKQFSTVGSVSQTVGTGGSALAHTSSRAVYTRITPNYGGTLSSVTVTSTAVSGNMKCCVFADNGSLTGPGAIVQAAAAPVALIGGNVVFTFSPPVSLNRIPYWFGFMGDATGGGNWNAQPSQSIGAINSGANYSTFPQASPPVSNPDYAVQVLLQYSPTLNWPAVAEPQQDGVTSYVYDNVVGHNDLYGIASIPVTPATVVAVTTRGFAQKSDAGSRTGAMQLQSGAANVQSSNGSTLSTSFAWMWRTDLTDPATGAAWTPTAVNNTQIGPIVLT